MAQIAINELLLSGTGEVMKIKNSEFSHEGFIRVLERFVPGNPGALNLLNLFADKVSLDIAIPTGAQGKFVSFPIWAAMNGFLKPYVISAIGLIMSGAEEKEVTLRNLTEKNLESQKKRAAIYTPIKHDVLTPCAYVKERNDTDAFIYVLASGCMCKSDYPPQEDSVLGVFFKAITNAVTVPDNFEKLRDHCIRLTKAFTFLIKLLSDLPNFLTQ